VGQNRPGWSGFAHRSERLRTLGRHNSGPLRSKSGQKPCSDRTSDCARGKDYTGKDCTTGQFQLTSGSDITFTLPAGVALAGGHLSFGPCPAVNCPSADCLPAPNIAEFSLNGYARPASDCNGGTCQDSADISAIYGVNADIVMKFSGGVGWTNGVTLIENKALLSNKDNPGVFPIACQDCIVWVPKVDGKDGAPIESCLVYPHTPVNGTCSATRVCQLNRLSPATSDGGTVEIDFMGFCGNVGDSCCPGNTCNPGSTCSSGKCQAATGAAAPQASDCGLLGQACCAGNTCTDKNTICNSGACVECGAPNQICCAGNICQSGACNNGKCADPNNSSCGAVGQPCCIPGNTCDNSGLACISALCVPKFIP
jgi:hypothetical protein